MSTAKLSDTELDDKLAYLLSPVLSSRRTAAPLAQLIAPLLREQQDFILHWIEIVAHTNYEMAYQFAAAAPAALEKLDAAGMEAWIIEAMDTYDREGLHRGSMVFKQLDAHLQRTDAAHAANFREHAHVLELFVCGLAGRQLKLDTAAEAKTDTETLFLPSRIAVFPQQAENFRLYKILATLLWAQNRFGTHHADISAICAAYPDPQRAGALLACFENIRLEARITKLLPGIARDMARLRGAPVDPRCAQLTAGDATVHDSLELLKTHYDAFDPPTLPWRTGFHADAGKVRDARLTRERSELSALLAQLLHEHEASAKTPDANEATDGGRFSITGGNDATNDGTSELELRLDGMPIAPPDHVRQLLDSIRQDLGEIPDAYLQTGGEASNRDAGENETTGHDPADAEKNTFLYDEWDHKRRHYRKNWCALREFDVQPVTSNFVADTLAKYRPQIAQLKRSFEMLRDEDRLLKRQPVGDDIDLDALVSGYADLKNGMELPERLLTRRHKNERDLAVLFMIDMSGSTKGWINDAERESLVMLCEALEVLGDRYAIYGFSGLTRQRCEIYRIKRFDEIYDDTVRQRIAGITPQDYTRMGVAIRHLTRLLNEMEARTRLLITLSDGKPDDYSDNYRGEYGIEDTRQALIEAHRSGIKPFCITIDHEARDYLPHLYGPVNWALVDDVNRLPLKVSDIYRHLTT